MGSEGDHARRNPWRQPRRLLGARDVPRLIDRGCGQALDSGTLATQQRCPRNALRITPDHPGMAQALRHTRLGDPDAGAYAAGVRGGPRLSAAPVAEHRQPGPSP